MARVLIVDDDAGVRNMLRRHLVRDFRAEVSEASDGVAALDFLLRNKCDLVLLDLRMPGLDGVKTLQALRRSPVLVDLPVVLVTGVHDPARLREAMTLGIAGFITKPFSAPVLQERLSGVLAADLLPEAQAPTIVPAVPAPAAADAYAERCLAAAAVAVRRELEHITGHRVTPAEGGPGCEYDVRWTLATAAFEARRARWTLSLVAPAASALTVASLGAAALKAAGSGRAAAALRWLSLAALDGVRDAVDVTAADDEPVCLGDLAAHETAAIGAAGERWLAIPAAGVTMRLALARHPIVAPAQAAARAD